MNQERLLRDFKIIAEIFDEMSVQDKLRTALLIELFENDIHEIAEKYDYTKPMHFEMRRTDI